MPKQLSLVEERPDTSVDAAVERLHASMLAFTHRLQATARRWWQPNADLTRSEVQVLRIVADHGECRSKDVAVRLEVGPGVVSRQLAALAERGMVGRRRDPDDGRAELLHVTARGHEVLASVRAAYLARLRERFDTWEPARLDAAADLVDQLTESLAAPDTASALASALVAAAADHHHTEDPA